jgi:hypothetical protein
MSLDKAEQDRIYAFVAAMVSVANNKEESELFVRLMTTSEHRTNQQTFFRNILFPIMTTHKDKHSDQYDLRNAATVHFCQRIENELDTTGFPYI